MTEANDKAVSVIVPLFNAVPTIAATIESLRTQSFGDWEAIVVDDGSADSSADAARTAAGSDRRIAILAQQNRGVSAGRNLALARATGRFVLFLDADDAIGPDHIANLITSAARHSRAAAIYCDWRLVGRGGIAGARRRAELALCPAAVLARSCAFPVHAALTRRDSILNIGGFDESLRLCEDWDLWQRLARSGAVFRRCGTTLADYRLAPGSASSDLPAFLSSALTVIRRGHAGDVPWRDGLPRAETGMALWLGGRAVGAGQDPQVLLSGSDASIDRTYDAESAAATILDGLVNGLADPAPDWTRLWPELRPRLRDALYPQDSRLAMPDFARLVLRHCERLLLKTIPAGTRGLFGTTFLQGFDLGAPPPAVSLTGGAERFLGIVSDGPVETGRFELAPVRDLASGEIAAALADFGPAADRPVPPPPREPVAEDAHGTGYWEQVFETEDPWAYDNPYETLKYEQTLAAIPAGVGRALEVACAEGHFTRRLAATVAQLTATDISPTAVGRAQQRCQDLTNVSFAVLDAQSDPLPENLDLIVCSEMLYYIEDADELALIADRFAAALRPGGHLVMAHANLTADADRPHSIGFDWGHRYGARSIGLIFSQATDLSLTQEFRSDLYRIQVFRRPTEAEKPPAPPLITRIAQAESLPGEVSRYLNWAGRAPTALAREPGGVPVLMYHRITDAPLPALARYATGRAAFQSQMRWLADEGFTTIGIEVLEAAIWEGGGLPDRAVAVTFDDGYRDNLTYALPVLRQFGQTATIFIPTGHVGATSGWDRIFGEPAPLMTWAELAVVREAGLSVASHGRSHRPLTALDANELAEELEEPRDRLRSQLSVTARSIAYPYGINDEAVQRAALAHGYRLAFTTEDRRWRPGDRVMAIPRVEIHGGMDLTDFAARLRAD